MGQWNSVNDGKTETQRLGSKRPIWRQHDDCRKPGRYAKGLNTQLWSAHRLQSTDLAGPGHTSSHTMRRCTHRYEKWRPALQPVLISLLPPGRGKADKNRASPDHFHYMSKE